jgi:hypothetical protein
MEALVDTFIQLGLGNLSVFQNIQASSGAHTASYSMGTGVPSVKKPAVALSCDSLPSSAELKNEWSYTSTSPIYLHDVERDNFTFSTFFFYH